MPYNHGQKKINSVRGIFRRIYKEYKRGGLRHIVVGGLEKTVNELMGVHPRVYRRLAPLYYHWRASNDIYEYKCAPMVFKISYVCPHSIERKTNRDKPVQLNRRKLFGKVMDGNWDCNGLKHSDTVLHKSLEKHFIEGKELEETPYIQRKLSRIEEDSINSQFKNKKELIEYCNNIKKLHSSIKSNGYLTQEEIVNSEFNDSLYLARLDEVTVDVGRNGELLYVDGLHRLSIAKILNIEEIPVVFLVRHRKWMEYREQLCQNNMDIPDHPDLRDLK